MEQYYPDVVSIIQSANYSPSKEILIKSSLHNSKLDNQFIRGRLHDLENKIYDDSSSTIGTSKDLLESVLKSILNDAQISYVNIE